MSTETDLWGDLPAPQSMRPPVAILREQAQLLGEKTKHVLQAEVVTNVVGKSIQHELHIVASALDGYRYHVLNATHQTLLFPVSVVDLATRSGRSCQNEDEFLESVRSILGSDQTRKVIAALLSQSVAMS